MDEGLAVTDVPAPVAPITSQGMATPEPTASPDVLASLAPEVRQTVEPIFKPLQEKLSTYEKQLEAAKSSQEKASALDRLVQDADFQKYWAARNSRPEQAAPKTQGTSPAYSPEEYQAAYDKAMQGDPSAFAALQERQVQQILSRDIAPAMNHLNQKAREIELGVELGNLLQNHPDARELDRQGLLEPFLHYYTDRQGKPMEFAYTQAKRAHDSLLGSMKAQAAKDVQDKRGSITETPGTITADQGIVYLDNAEQVLRAQINAAVKGEKVQYRVKARQGR